MRYFPNPTPPEFERVVGLIDRQLAHWAQHGYGWWAVEERQTGQLIGWNGLQYLPDTDETEIGYLLDKAWWGQGLAGEGARAALAWGFARFDLPEVVGIVHPQNWGSRRVLEKIGMDYTGGAEYFGMHVRRYHILPPEVGMDLTERKDTG